MSPLLPSPPAPRTRRTSSISIISSPLNPNSACLPVNVNTSPTTQSPPLMTSGQGRPRGRTTSAIRAPPFSSVLSVAGGGVETVERARGGSLASPLSRVVSEGCVPLASDSSSASTSPTSRASPASPTSPNGFSGFWWGRDKEEGKDMDKENVKDKEEKEKKRSRRVSNADELDKDKDKGDGWFIARERVSQATVSILGPETTTSTSTIVGDVAHKVLSTAVGMLEFVPVPVPGLAPAARVLLGIWEAVQEVDTNRTQCLRLAERCADILLSVREEVNEAGGEVGEELRVPVGKLVESFKKIHTLLLTHLSRPFIRRYLKRFEIQAQIEACDRGLGEALGMFGLGIQIRILRVVQEGERRRREQEERGCVHHRHLVDVRDPVGLGLELPPRVDVTSSVGTVRPPMEASPSITTSASTSMSTPTLSPHPLLGTPTLPASTSTSTSDTLSPCLSHKRSPTLLTPIPPSPSHLRPSQILPTLRTLHSSQNTHDAARDAEDMRKFMRAALKAGSDVEMLRVLGIGRQEVIEGICSLQRALEGMHVGKDNQCDGGLRQRADASTSATGARGCGSVGTPTSRARASTSASDPTLDREFVESGLEALQRMSRCAPLPDRRPSSAALLPPWTITRHEIDIDPEHKIEVGFFSDVYKGKWKGRTVAVKVLVPPRTESGRTMFEREVDVWSGLRHPGVLELFGAGGGETEGDDDAHPWFFVCAYMRRGSLVEFLRMVERGLEGSGKEERRKSYSGVKVEGPVGLVPREKDLVRFMLEIAEGMEYLHANGVLHGDLKAANVLVDDDIHCVISDFGQSEMKSEAYNFSVVSTPRGTLRWQAPELMSGQVQSGLTPQMDVYAYAISCVEILGMGRMPWALVDDDTVRHFVLKESARPLLPRTRFDTPLLLDLLGACWHQNPGLRPSFVKIVEDFRAMREAFVAVGYVCEEVRSPKSSPMSVERSRKEREWNGYGPKPSSPDMRSGALPRWGSCDSGGSYIPSTDRQKEHAPDASPDSLETDGTFVTADEDVCTVSAGDNHSHCRYPSHLEDIVSSSKTCIPEPRQALYTPSEQLNHPDPSSLSESPHSSSFSHTLSIQSMQDVGLSLAMSQEGLTMQGCENAVPADDRVRMMRDERRYRLLLGHVFHPSLTLPLWDPSPVKLGAVGYLLKPEGRFVTLFNSFAPEKGGEGAAKALPSLYGYGRVRTGNHRQDRRNMAQRGYDAFVGLLTFKSRGGAVSSQNVSRRYSFPLRAGHKTARMFAESTMYRYMESLEVPKKWFKANVDMIMQTYGPTHHIQKEDLFLVIGTLDTQDYALFVSHNHPDGQAHFNVFSSPRNGQPWGTFTTDTEVPPELGGPSYDEPVAGHALSSSKVSSNGSNWDTVLIAKLKFKSDVLEPTSL